MDKETLDKIREMLKKLGHSEEEIEEAVAGLTEKAAEEESKTDEKSETDTPAEDTPVEEGGKDTPSDPVPPANEDDVPPADKPTDNPEKATPEGEEETSAPQEGDQKLPEGVEEVDPTNPVVDENPTIVPPATDPSNLIAELQGKLDEASKTIDGLSNRIGLLEEALRKSGIMEEESGKQSGVEVGIDDGSRTPAYHDDEQTLDDLVDRMNSYRR